MKAIVFIALTATIMILGTAATAHAQVRHVPPADAEAGKQLELVALAPSTSDKLVAQIRVRGTQAWTAVDLVRRDQANWVAVIPAETVMPPGLDYFIVAGTQPVFATPEWPHTLAVNATPDAERKGRDELRFGGRRSRINVMGEWVEYGKANGVVDHFYRLDGDFSYRLWSYPLEEIRVGASRLRGDTLAGTSTMCTGSGPCPQDAGFSVAGWFELGLAPIEGVRLDGRLIVMATKEGFAVGGRGEVRFGNRDASHVALGSEYLADVGANGFFRLGWGTVPKFPMSATVEITNLPASHRNTGVRLYYDIAREVSANVRLGFRVGYAARNQSVAGFTGGAGATVEF